MVHVVRAADAVVEVETLGRSAAKYGKRVKCATTSGHRASIHFGNEGFTSTGGK